MPCPATAWEAVAIAAGVDETVSITDARGALAATDLGMMLTAGSDL